MSARKIAHWHEAGLIDAETRDRLIAYENNHARPLVLQAVWGVGALAIALGVVSVVASNWEEIPGLVRLAVHLALITGLLVVALLREERPAVRTPWASEALLFVTAALGLTFFGHLGQVYQTSSPLWQPLALWLALFAPLLLLTGRSWPTAAALMGGAMWTVWDYADAQFGYGAAAPDTPLRLWIAIVTALPVLFAPFAAWMRGRDTRSSFWRRLEQIGLAYAVGGASFACALASLKGFDAGELSAEGVSMAVRGGIGLIAGGLVALARPGASGRMAAAIIAGAGAALPIAFIFDGAIVLAALLFFLLWTGIAAAALAAEWRGVFQLAVGVIALRLIILSFELAADLLTSGFGLILAGVLILGVAWVAVRVSKRFAPDPEPDA